jgi:hypothetical protein
MQPTVILDLEQPTTGLKPVGYSVTWKLRDVKIYRSLLFGLLQQHGLDKYLPEAPTRYLEVRRALEDWARDHRKSGVAADKTLVMSDRSNKDYSVFYMVARDLNMDLSIDLDVKIRVALDKKTAEVVFVVGNTGDITPSQSDRALAASILPYIDRYHDLFLTHDVAAMIARILVDLDGINTGHDGTFFVPEASREALMTVKNLVKDLPGNDPWLTTLPIQGDDEGRQESAREVHDGFMDEITRLAKEMDAIASRDDGSVKACTITKRLEEYADLRQKLELYRDFLGVYVKDAAKGIDNLDDRAQAVLTSNNAARAAKEAAPAPAPAPVEPQA